MNINALNNIARVFIKEKLHEIQEHTSIHFLHYKTDKGYRMSPSCD